MFMSCCILIFHDIFLFCYSQPLCCQILCLVVIYYIKFVCCTLYLCFIHCVCMVFCNMIFFLTSLFYKAFNWNKILKFPFLAESAFMLLYWSIWVLTFLTDLYNILIQPYRYFMFCYCFLNISVLHFFIVLL